MGDHRDHLAKSLRQAQETIQRQEKEINELVAKLARAPEMDAEIRELGGLLATIHADWLFTQEEKGKLFGGRETLNDKIKAALARSEGGE